MRHHRRRYPQEESNVFKCAFMISGLLILIWMSIEIIMIFSINLIPINESSNINKSMNVNKLKVDITAEQKNKTVEKAKLSQQQQLKKQQIRFQLDNLHRDLEKEKVQQMKLFEKISPNFPMPPDIYPKTILQNPEKIVDKKSLGFEYTNNLLKKHGCSMTVTLMDPRIALAPRLGDVWISLESMASNVDRNATCVVLQTSECIVYNDRKLLTGMIESKALPLFLEMIHRGNVRVSIINHINYKMKNCHNFFSPSNAFMNVEYWGPTEYKEEDSDLVLIIQNDSVMCHFLNADLWRDLAFVGGPWPPKANMHNNPVPEDGTCKALPRFWSQWTLPKLQHAFQDRWKVGNITAYKAPAPKPITPSLPLDVLDVKQYALTFPKNICTDNNGPMGNGGFSIRSRKWMRRSIATCPHVHYSGLKINPLCQVYENIPEDLYFATVLRGLHAPMPTAFEASLFGAEMIFPHHVIEYYGPNTKEEQIPIVLKRWGHKYSSSDQEDISIEEKFSRMSKAGLIVPIGLHKPWWYHDIFLMLSPHFKNNCPYFEWMLIGRGWNSAS